jgi:uncharacterized protein (UPF0332 family)
MDNPEKAAGEAQSWLEGAARALEGGDSNVACAMAIHSIIRANDALCLKFLGRKATRHDDAHIMFNRILSQGKLPAREKGHAFAVARAMQNKSGADYGKTEFSKEQARNTLIDAEKFLEMANGHL